MDILCPKCAEPWDHDELHAQAEFSRDPWAESYSEAFDRVKAEFYADGCTALGGAPCAPTSKGASARAHVASALYAELGDDLDGVASELDDAMAMGLI